MEGPPPIPEDLWARVPPEAQAALRFVWLGYEQRLAQLTAQVEDLRQQLQQSSHNSSKPPSSDPPGLKRAPPRRPSGKKSGGQPGHPLQTRPPLEPTSPPVICKPTACRCCGQALHGDDPAPRRHQVLELPPVKPEVTEYHLHRLDCPGCGAGTRADLPAGVPAGQYGPRLQATFALLAGAYRLSKRAIETLSADVLGVPVCAGQVCALEAETADATESVVQELRGHVRTQPANIDETGWRHNQKRGWLWAVVTSLATVFHIDTSRSSAVARSLLGAQPSRVISSDRYSAYSWLPVRRRQVCWAHLRRDFQAMVDRGGAGAAVGEELLCCAQDLFTWWHRVRDGTLSRAALRQYLGELRRHVRDQLKLGSACGCAKTAATCREILKVEPALWTFARVAGVEPTNNAVERSLRHAVQWRKTSYGTQGETGRRFVQNVLSVVATCRQQERNVLEFLTHCCQAALRGEPPPSLLPHQA
jgi:transposase